jgi:hypothetical protein
MSIRCYSQRLLNPFRGVMNIIEYADAEAVTLDGVNWDIYVRNSELVLDLENRSKVQTSDIRYGSWSEKEGLKRGSIFPSEDFKVLENRGAIVYEYLLQHHKDIPFTFEDHYELWLLDKDDQPLALLNSVANAEDVELDTSIQWKAGIACGKTFNSKHWPQTSDKQNCVAEYLNEYINGLADINPAAQWFYRNNKNCSGLQGINLNKQLEHRQLDCTRFPELFISMKHHDNNHKKLINDFFNWQAPFILLLRNLDDIDREHFEDQARLQALITDRLCLLYPKTINEALIKAARVEAVLRKNQPQLEKNSEEVMPTYYIEMGVTRTN